MTHLFFSTPPLSDNDSSTKSSQCHPGGIQDSCENPTPSPSMLS